jgi:hypothetical protein
VSLWTKETAEDIRLKEALELSAPCPWLFWMVDVAAGVAIIDLWLS